MRRALGNIGWLTLKELVSLVGDPVMLFLIVYGFTGMIYVMARGVTLELQNASVAFADEDRSGLSRRLRDALLQPQFLPPEPVAVEEIDAAMDAGRYTFAVDVPPDFEADARAGRRPTLQLNIDATAIAQAGVGGEQIRRILLDEGAAHFDGGRSDAAPPVVASIRTVFNPNLVHAWFMGVNGLTVAVAMLGVLLSGAAVIREREHGTLEHLLVMPLRPVEIMLAKIGANALVVLTGTGLSLWLVVHHVLGAPIVGSVTLFLGGVALVLFALASLGISLATLTRSMPQFGLLAMLVFIPMSALSGANTPIEAMPDPVQWVMLVSPTTHFVRIAQAVLFRGAGLGGVWSAYLAVAVIGGVFFAIALVRFRASVAAAGRT